MRRANPIAGALAKIPNKNPTNLIAITTWSRGRREIVP